jgi:hypothetical protein
MQSLFIIFELNFHIFRAASSVKDIIIYQVASSFLRRESQGAVTDQCVRFWSY